MAKLEMGKGLGDLIGSINRRYKMLNNLCDNLRETPAFQKALGGQF
jgi:hypothetical protein